VRAEGAPPLPPQSGDTEESASKLPLIIGLVVGALALCGVAAFVLGGGDPPASGDPVTSLTTNQPDEETKPNRNNEQKGAKSMTAEDAAGKEGVAVVGEKAPPTIKARARWIPVSAADREMLNGKVATAVAEAVNALTVDQKKLAKRMGLAWPLPKAQSRAELDEAVANAIALVVDKKHPPRTLQAYMEPALKRHGPYQIGTSVTLSLRYGKGDVSGILREVGTQTFKIDTTDYPLHHLETADRDRMSEVTAKAKAEEVAQDWFKASEGRRAALADEIRSDVEKEVYGKAGLSKKKGVWVSASDLLMAEEQKERKKQAEALSTRLEREIYEAAGYDERAGLWGKMTE
jgi:hypothetical protein